MRVREVEDMKRKSRLYILIVGFLIVCVVGPVLLGTGELAKPGSQPVRPQERSKISSLDQELRQAIETLREYNLVKELDLPESRTEQLVATLQNARQIQRSYQIRRAEIEHQLANILQGSEPDQAHIRQILQALDGVKQQYQTQMLQADQQLWSLLSPEEQARYILFQHHFTEQLQDMIIRIRQQRIQSSTQRNFLLRRKDEESVIRQPR